MSPLPLSTAKRTKGVGSVGAGMTGFTGIYPTLYQNRMEGAVPWDYNKGDETGGDSNDKR